MSLEPTPRTYALLQAAYQHFNQELFSGRLPHCLITLQRKAKSLGYFAPKRFSDGSDVTDEIALNPAHFATCGKEDVLSTLVHEMVHLEVAHFGKPCRPGYHDKQWATAMDKVGLVPSTTGAPGGKRVGQRCSHYIEPEGRYQRAFRAFIAGHQGELYADLWGDDAKKKKKAASKTKYSCPSCDLNAWAKPGARLVCGDCEEPLVAEGQAAAGAED